MPGGLSLFLCVNTDIASAGDVKMFHNNRVKSGRQSHLYLAWCDSEKISGEVKSG